MSLCLIALERRDHYITSNEYRGYDPFDVLESPLFKLLLLRSNKVLRLGAQKTPKRFPLNLRSLLRIEKANDPVTLGLCVQAYSHLSLLHSFDRE